MFSKEVVAALEGSSMIRKMFEEGNALRKQYGDDKVYDYSLGNPTIEPPAEVKQALKDIANSDEKGMHRYMSNSGYEFTREAIAKMLSKEASFEIPASNVVMTVGAAGGLNVTLRSLLNPGEEVIVLAPCFMEYFAYVKNFKGVVKVVETDEKFRPDVKAIEEAITPNTKAIIINSPNNPTGVVYTAEELTALNEVLLRKGEEFGTVIYAVSDEPYTKIVYDVEVPSNFDMFDNAICINCFSKSLALPGERIGFVAASPKIKDVDILMDALIYANRTLGYVNAPATAQRLITAALDATVDVATYRKNRDLLYSIITKAGFEVDMPEGAFYFFMKSPIADDGEFVEYAKKNYQIIMVPGSGFMRPGYVRLCYCFDEQIIKNSEENFIKLGQDYNK